MVRHVTYTHRKTKQLPCPKCDKKFGSPDNLRRHLKLHQMNEIGQKDFKCNFCDYSSNRRSNLRLHKSKMHKELYAEELRNEVLEKLHKIDSGNIDSKLI